MQFLLNHISTIISTYSGAIPLPIFLKNYYKQYPKLGSRDRKALSEAVFIYYRYASFFAKDSDQIEIIARAITNDVSAKNPFLHKLFSNIEVSDKGIDWPSILREVLVPDVSEGLRKEEWLSSLLAQPRLFIRLRNNQERSLNLLRENNIELRMPDGDDSNCVSLPNGTAVEKILDEEDYVVQDWASQRSVKLVLAHISATISTAWDVCSGAGGKSIFLKDELKSLKLLSTDIRKTILHNLAMRFNLYKLKKPEILVLDSTNRRSMADQLQQRKFDLIVCDVPCSGSGTWARTPEQFHFFDATQLNKFKELQFPIAVNAQEYLNDNGLFAYITCSVFKAENEEVVAQLLTNTCLKLVEQRLIKGIEINADSMFCAIFKKR